tara:strand:+ start:56 stop:1144 length:1089 start_codon:yes stop_codon:yes gene_type:complete
MPYKQPKNTPIHNDGASEVVTAIIGAAKLVKMGIVAAKAAKAAKVAKVAATAVKAAKAAKVGKAAMTAGKFAKAGKVASTTAKAGKTAATTAKATTKGAIKLTQNTMPKLQKLGQAGQKSVAKAQKLAKFSSKHQKLGKAIEKTKSFAGKVKGKADVVQGKIDKGFDKAAEITGKDAGDLKSKAGEIGINKATEIEGNIKAKNNSSLTAEDFTQPLGLTQNETEPLDPRYEAKDQPSSYSNPTGASMKGDMPKGYKSSVSDNFKTPKTNYQRFFQNLANNSVNANIGGVKVNVGHVGLIAGHLIGKGVDAVKTKKRLNGIKKQNKIKNESAARAKEEVANKKIMQDIDNRENNIANKTFNKK